MEFGLRKILVIESDDSLRETLCMMLMDEGYNVTGVSGCMQGAQMMGQFNPDILLLDILMHIIMSKQDGFENIIKQRNAMTDLKVVAMAGEGDLFNTRGYLKTASLIKAEKQLFKPFSKGELMGAISDVLKKQL